MRRASAAALAALTVLAGGAAAAGGPAPAQPAAAARITVDDFSHGAAAWQRTGRPVLRTRRSGADYVLQLTATSAPAGVTRALPSGWTVGLDLRPDPGASVELDLGRAGRLGLHAAGRRLVAGGTHRLHATQAPGRWYRLETATAGAAPTTLDGRRLATRRGTAAGRLAIRVTHGTVALRALVAGPATDPGALLVERLAWMHTRTPERRSPIGTGLDGRLRFSRSWTTGFWPGALWQAFDLTGSPMFERWALRATRENFGRERVDTHDVGFMYERSSVAAYDHLCTAAKRAPDCAALEHSAVTAASTLLRLAATNAAAATIPTRSKTLCAGCRSLAEADTIIDSVMNLPLLFWASDVTGDSRYRDVAARHVRNVARLMVRADGSTWSSVHFRRNDGKVIRYHTHQGYRDDSAWARGQAWAVYGFSAAAAALHDGSVLDAAQRTARYVMKRLPEPAVPRYDYDAPASAPHDVSAGLITAAGLLRLAAACDALAAACDPGPQATRDYAHGLLAASLADIHRRPPLGLVGHQVYGLGGLKHWDDDAELIFGLDYALEALNGA
ncbi:MAG: hypothetical protein ACJ76Z_01800 [Thermoleophilaceae bacterium]